MHTPGPWKAIKDPMMGAKERWCVYAMEDENHFRFSGKVKVVPADCFGPNAKANARLIAASPCLLEELKWLVLAAVNALNHHDLMRNMPEGAALIQRIGDAKKAIAKAEEKS